LIEATIWRPIGAHVMLANSDEVLDLMMAEEMEISLPARCRHRVLIFLTDILVVYGSRTAEGE
jgi:hypothetical protein